MGNFLKALVTINFPKSPTFIGNFCKVFKIYHFWATFKDIWQFFMFTLLMDGPVGQQKPKNVRFLFFNKNGQSPASFSYNFVFFQTNITFLQQINVKNVHPVPIRCWDSNPQPSEHESPAITTRPGLLPIRFLFMFFFKKGPILASFCLFSFFSRYNFNTN